MNYITTNTQLQDMIPKLGEMKEFTLDLETSGFDPYTNKVLLFQVGNDEIQWVIDTRKVDPTPLKPIIEDKSYKVIGQNLKFDYKFLKHQFNIELENVGDIFLTEKIFKAGVVHMKAPGHFALDDMVKKYCGVQLEDKDEGVRRTFIGMKDEEFSKEQLKYAADDIIWTHRVHNEQQKFIDKQNLQSTINLENGCLPAFSDLEYNGFYLDREEWLKVLDDTRKEYDKYDGILREMFAPVDQNLFGECDINFKSSADTISALSKLGYDIDSTKEQTLLKLPEEIGQPIIKLHKLHKAVDSFGEAYLDFINPVTNRVHANVNQIGAATGRVSFDRPNLQQIKKEVEYRGCFKAQEEGHQLITTDYAGQELRIITEICQEPKWVEILNDPSQDLHKYVATILFDIPLEKVTKPIRDIAKNLNFGVAYGAKAQKIMMFYNQAGIECDIVKAERVLSEFTSQFPRVVGSLDLIANNAVTSGEARTLGGRPRFYSVEQLLSKMDGGDTFHNRRRATASVQRESRNSVVQGSGADMLKMACKIIRDRIKKYDLSMKLVHLVHDETVVESFKDHEQNQWHVEKSMKLAQEHFQSLVPAEVDGFIGSVWTKP